MLGVLSREDYQRHILRLAREAKAEVVEMMQNVSYLSRVSRGELLRMAMLFKPVTFYRGDLIAAQGSLPSAVTFVCSGVASMTAAVTGADGKQKNVEVMQLAIGSTVEPIGMQIVGDDAKPFQWSLRATTVCEGFRIARNVAKRVLNKRFVLQALKEHEETVATLIARRVEQSNAGEDVRSSLGFARRNPSHRARIDNAIAAGRAGRTAAKGPAASAKKPPPDYRRPSVYVPEVKDELAEEQRQIMRRADYARHHPHRRVLHQPKSPRSLPAAMLRDRSVVAFGKSIRQPGLATHEDQELLWCANDPTTFVGVAAGCCWWWWFVSRLCKS